MTEYQDSLDSENFSTEMIEEPVKLPWVERNGFPHWVMAAIWLIFGLILFHGLTNVLLIIFVILPNVSDLTNETEMLKAVSDNINTTFLINTIGQIFIIGLASYFVSMLHTSKANRSDFLRLKVNSKVLLVTGMSIVLLFSSIGMVNFLGWLNYIAFERIMEIFPALEFFKDAQTQMTDMIVDFINSDNSVILGVLFIGLVPAIFEEVMFRGYIMRAFEISWGIMPAILFSSLLFGMYHIQPSNILGLASLGALFAYVTYISDSLIPAMILHLVNNGGQVIYGSMNTEFLESAVSSEFGMPWYWVLLSLIISSGLIYLMYQIRVKPGE